MRKAYKARGNAVTRVAGGMRWRVDERVGDSVGYGVGEWGDVLGDGVNGQRKTRGEAVTIGVSGRHGAHIVVRESVKLLTRVLLPWVRGGSRTMRDVFCDVKDGRNGRL